MEWIVVLYFIITNGWLFYWMRFDKGAARKHRWRVPERSLLLLGLLGGGFGGALAMVIYHHKTKHRYFKWCFGANILCWVLALLFYWNGGIL